MIITLFNMLKELNEYLNNNIFIQLNIDNLLIPINQMLNRIHYEDIIDNNIIDILINILISLESHNINTEAKKYFIECMMPPPPPLPPQRLIRY